MLREKSGELFTVQGGGGGGCFTTIINHNRVFLVHTCCVRILVVAVAVDGGVGLLNRNVSVV